MTAGPPPPTTAAAPARRSRVAAAVGGVGLAMSGVMMLGLGFVNEPLARSLGVGQGVTLFYYSLYQGVGAVSLALLAGPLVQRLGVRRTVLFGGLWSGAMLFLMGGTTGLPQLFGLAAGLGLLFHVVAFYLPPLIIMRWFAHGQGVLLGFVMGLGGVGGIVLGTVMPPVMTAGGWPAGFRALAVYVWVLTLASGLFLLRGHPPPEPVVDRRVGADFGAPAAPVGGTGGTPTLVLLMVALSLFHLSQGIYQHFPPVVAERGVDLTGAGHLVASTSFIIMVASPLVGLAADRFGVLKVSTVLVALYGVSFLGIWTAHGFAALVVPVVLFAIGTTTPFVLTALLVTRLMGTRHFERHLALAAACLPVGSALGAPVWGFVSDSTDSYDGALLASAAVSGLLVALLVLARVVQRRR